MKTDLDARPMFVHQKDSSAAHLEMVFVALALSHTMQKATSKSREHIIKPSSTDATDYSKTPTDTNTSTQQKYHHNSKHSHIPNMQPRLSAK